LGLRGRRPSSSALQAGRRYGRGVGGPETGWKFRALLESRQAERGRAPGWAGVQLVVGKVSVGWQGKAGSQGQRTVQQKSGGLSRPGTRATTAPSRSWRRSSLVLLLVEQARVQPVAACCTAARSGRGPGDSSRFGVTGGDSKAKEMNGKVYQSQLTNDGILVAVIVARRGDLARG